MIFLALSACLRNMQMMGKDMVVCMECVPPCTWGAEGPEGEGGGGVLLPCGFEVFMCSPEETTLVFVVTALCESKFAIF